MSEQETLNPGATQEETTENLETLLTEDALHIEVPRSGEIRKGVIASISPSQILVSIGTKSEGVISGRELELMSEEERAALQVGQEIPVYVLRSEDVNGNVILSYRRARDHMAWQRVAEAKRNDETIHTRITGYNKGGLEVDIFGLRGFLPASQIGTLRRAQSSGEANEERWKQWVGEPIDVRILEFDRERHRLVVSERAAEPSRQEMKTRAVAALEEGKIYTGRVTSLADFGAFVNVNGADGLVHLSEISWEHVSHPREVLKVGQEVQVKVIGIDRENLRISLSIRQTMEDPWKQKVAHYSRGQLVEGVITRLTKFGAFARLDSGVEGLIHISEISDQRIHHPKEVLREGEVKTLRIIRIDHEQRRIGLSLRQVDSAAFADKDFKMLTQELEEIEQQESEGSVSEK
ncbi:MAG: S1 RNA-binding domain-containing protein [Anaerolineales bacterium]